MTALRSLLTSFVIDIFISRVIVPTAQNNLKKRIFENIQRTHRVRKYQNQLDWVWSRATLSEKKKKKKEKKHGHIHCTFSDFWSHDFYKQALRFWYSRIKHELAQEKGLFYGNLKSTVKYIPTNRRYRQGINGNFFMPSGTPYSWSQSDVTEILWMEKKYILC